MLAFVHMRVHRLWTDGYEGAALRSTSAGDNTGNTQDVIRSIRASGLNDGEGPVARNANSDRERPASGSPQPARNLWSLLGVSA